MDYGKKIKYVMDKIRGGMTLTELHKVTGLSLSYLSEAINGKSNMSIKSLEKVADALNVSSSYLLDEKAVTFKEILDASNYDPPAEIVDFLSEQDKLPYIVLAKKMSDQGLSPAAFEEIFYNIKIMMDALKK